MEREEVLIETKVWINDYGLKETQHAFDKGAGKLGVEELDLLILHQPVPTEFDRTLTAYKGLEMLLEKGKVRAIGVSNFIPEHLERLLAETSIVPAVNQIEVHPYFQQTELEQVHRKQGIATQPGRRSAALPPTATREDRRSRTPPCWRSPAPTISQPRR